MMAAMFVLIPRVQNEAAKVSRIFPIETIE